VKRYTSPPLELPAREPGDVVSRADLIFYDVDHSGPSYEALVYLDNPKADLRTGRDPAAGYVGSFTIFGHGGCYGDLGHCDVVERLDEFDVRPPHALTPWTRTVILPDGVLDRAGESVTVTLVAVEPGANGAVASDALKLSRVRFAAYLD